ncbi:hypothetical protein [Acidovorax sp. NCPPB 4044]|uniref:hypothetical protein n=1 Tax=Acidovorax sp. NCPPB 4044 TaxID=2940490 RepID=UPI0023039DC4|nr:hypothetical protein [Acidovorax sp. NCPPB 4044]MDA8523440.1 hypothetical protein [Acidovorax sp. NCPPB 4044]
MTNDDYRTLKIFIDKHFEWYAKKYPTTPAGLPSEFLEQIERKSAANAKAGLQMAIDDIVEETAEWQPVEVADADARFLAAGTFTLSEVRRRYSKKYLQLLKCGEIRSETEYYLLKGISAGGSIEPGAAENKQIEEMLAAFEEKIMQAR